MRIYALVHLSASVKKSVVWLLPPRFRHAASSVSLAVGSSLLRVLQGREGEKMFLTVIIAILTN